VVKPALIAAALAAAISLLAAPSRARAQEDALPRLWEPDQAVAYLLTGRAGHPIEEQAARWDGALSGGITRALFGAYHLVLSSQDSATCVFSPSCSRFSQKAIGSCGFLEGSLLTLDRLLRDHPLAVPFYPRAEGGRLLRDDPGRYCLTRSP
jgi:putative component of membrane protein insertase Oxa1/YidC/SpoIIIJ protein YidD